MFYESLKLAKQTKIELVQIHHINQTKKIFEVDQRGKRRLVEIAETVSCNCLHVIWVICTKNRIRRKQIVNCLALWQEAVRTQVKLLS